MIWREVSGDSAVVRVCRYRGRYGRNPVDRKLAFPSGLL